MPDFLEEYGAEAQCAQTLEAMRWSSGFACPRCITRRITCCGMAFARSFSATHAGTVFQGTKLPLTIYLINQTKTGLSALVFEAATGCELPHGVADSPQAHAGDGRREDRYVLEGKVPIDDAYLGGELSGGKVGRGSENKVPFVAAVSLSDDGHPLRIKLTPVSGFTLKAISV